MPHYFEFIKQLQEVPFNQVLGVDITDLSLQ